MAVDRPVRADTVRHMLNALRHRRLPLLTGLLFALAVVLNGFAHRTLVSAPDPALPDLSAYVLPDGTVPVLCRTLADDADGGFAPGICPLYSLNAVSALPPAPCDELGRPVAYAAIAYTQATVTASAAVRTATPPVRAPPA